MIFEKKGLVFGKKSRVKGGFGVFKTRVFAVFMYWAERLNGNRIILFPNSY